MFISRFQFEQSIKKGELFNSYVFFGGKHFILDDCLKKLINRVFNGQVVDFNLNKFDGENLDLYDCSNALKTVPVMSGYRVVLVNNLCYSNLSKVDFAKFLQMFQTVPSTSILIVTILTEQFNYSQIKKFRVCFKKIEKCAMLVDCDVNSGSELFQFFYDYILNLGSRISRANFNFLVSRLSANWRLIFSELEKLSLYAFGREILKSDILLLTQQSLVSTAFDLANAILNFNVNKALEILQKLMSLNVSVFLICGAINSCFIDLYRVFLGLRRGWSNSQIATAFGYSGQEFKIINAKKVCGKFNLVKLKKCIFVLAELELKIKSTSVDRKFLLERAIVEMTIGS